MKNIIFYFSGTGNSLYVAEKIAEKLGDCEIQAMVKFDFKQKITAERIGLAFPTYYWGLPNIVKDFIAKIQVSGSPYFFICYTYGGYSGVTMHMTRKLLKSREWELKSAFGFQLPQNFILSSFRVPKEEMQQEEFRKANQRFPDVAKIIFEKDTYFEPEPLHVRPFHFIGYRLNSKQSRQIPSKDSNFVISKACKGCGICISPLTGLKTLN